MKDRNKKSLYKINLHYIVLQSLYWMGYATVWASRSAVLLYKGCSNAQTGAITAISLLSAAFVFQPAMSSVFKPAVFHGLVRRRGMRLPDHVE